MINERVADDDDRIDSFATGKLPLHKSKRRVLPRHSPRDSQDDKSPSPLKPSTLKKVGAEQKKKGLEKVTQAYTEDEYDTDFKDSANGDQEFTDEMVSKIVDDNKQTTDTCMDLIAQMESMVAGVLALSEEQDEIRDSFVDEKVFLSQN